MFTEITWSMYLRVMAATLFIYYTALLLRSYFPNLRPSWSYNGDNYSRTDAYSAKETDTTGEIMNGKGNLTPTGEFSDPGYNDYEIIEELVERVKGTLKEAVEQNLTVTSLTPKLAGIINDYPVLGKSTFRPSINEFIATESQQHGFTTFTEESAELLWRTV